MPSARSGIPIFLTQESYDDQIVKHGQWVRWVRSQTCPCILSETNQPDPNCAKCNGRGRLFSYQKELDVIGENSAHNLSEVDPTNSPILRVSAVRRGLGGTDAYTVDSFTDDEILISVTDDLPYLPKHYERIEVDYTFSAEQDYSGAAVYHSHGRFTVALTPVRTRNQEPIVGEVSTVTQLRNTTKGVTYTVSSTARNEIYVTFADPGDEPATGDTITCVCKYINPSLFLLIGVTERLRREEPWIVNSGEALLVVPYNRYVGVGDIVTQLAGFQRGESVLQVSHDDIDELPAFEVRDIVRIVDVDTEYVKDTDYILWGRNQIKWIGNKPSGTYSAMFLYHPTFSTAAQRPMLRSGENLRLPRRLSLEVYDKVNPRADAEVPVF